MQSNNIKTVVAIVCAGAVWAACDDSSSATGPRTSGMAPSAAEVTALAEPFTVRAPLDAFFINQPSQVMIRTDARADIAMQRLVTAPGPGKWHTHPGPSFGIVDAGEVKITRYSKKDGCVETIYRKGDAYFEVANEVHRADVIGTEHAVEYKVRFYTPVGAAFSSPPAEIPSC
jgi:quercetin dioxygenase-like cupin family protein